MPKRALPYFLFCFVFLFAGLTLASCGEEKPTQPTVHMSETAFLPASITIHKGETIRLVNDANVYHIVQNGFWQQNGQITTSKEEGAVPYDATFQGPSNKMIGPFNTTGTFNYYCNIHTGMNLTVIVE